MFRPKIFLRLLMALVFSVSSLGITVFYSTCKASGKLTVSVLSPKTCCGKTNRMGFSKSCCQLTMQHLKVAPMRVPTFESPVKALANFQVLPPINHDWMALAAATTAVHPIPDPPEAPPLPVGRAAHQHFCRYRI
jgi:hypothetical protein